MRRDINCWCWVISCWLLVGGCQSEGQPTTEVPPQPTMGESEKEEPSGYTATPPLSAEPQWDAVEALEGGKGIEDSLREVLTDEVYEAYFKPHMGDAGPVWPPLSYFWEDFDTSYSYFYYLGIPQEKDSNQLHSFSLHQRDGLADTNKGILLVNLFSQSEHHRIKFDLRYATKNNFLKTPLYDYALPWVSPDTYWALLDANEYLLERGYCLKLWDAYRPKYAQYRMWDALPDDLKHKGYVADPSKGSHHNKGRAVDVTLVTSDGKEVPMPTDFDDFSVKARSYRTIDIDPAAIKNRTLLQEAMIQAGFTTINSEWWHFNGPDAK